MKYLLAGLIIGGFIGQNIAYGVSYYHPRTVEVPVVGECTLPPQVAHMRGLVENMQLPTRVGMEEQRAREIDLIAQLIEGDRP